MKRRLLIGTLLLVLAATAAEAAPPLANRLPSETVLYAGWAGRNEAFDGSVVGSMLTNPAGSELIKALREAATDKAGDEGAKKVQALTNGIDMLLLAAGHEAAVAVVPPAAKTEGPPIPSAVLMVDLGKDHAAFAKHLEAVIEGVGAMPMLTHKDISGVPFRTFRPGEGAPLIALGYVGNVLMLTIGDDMPAKCIDVVTGKAKSLATNAAFLAAHEQVGGANEQATLYVDVKTIKKIALPLAANASGTPLADINKIIAALGFDRLTSIVAATRIVDRGLYTQTRIVSPAPHRGVMMLAASSSGLTLDDMALVPADADFVATCKMNPAKLLAELRRVVTAIDPNADAEIGGKLAEADKKLGFSLTDDLLGQLGDQWTFVMSRSLGGPLTGMAMIVDIKDTKRFTASMAKIKQLAKDEADADDNDPMPILKQATVAGTTVTHVQFPTLFAPVAPAWAIHDNRLILAPWPQVVSAVIKGTPAGPISKDPAFVANWRKLSGKPTSVTYVNLPKITRDFYFLPMVLWTWGSNALQEQGVDANAAWLPDLPTLERHIWPAFSAVTADKQGVSFESYGSLPLVNLLMPNAAMAPLMASIALPSLAKARDGAKDAIDQSQLKGIGTAIEVYRCEANSAPPGLATLVDMGFLRKSQLIGAHSKTGKTSYVYIRLPNNADEDLIAVYDDPRIHGRNETAVLFRGTNVAMMTVDQEFWDLVAKSKAAAVKGGK